jgi:hypothetical protein
MLSNPPYGVEWEQVEKQVREEHAEQGALGRFGPGLPRISDGSLLFLLHLISKMHPVDKATGHGGSRIGIVFNGSPLFTAGAGSGESEIRRHILENDLLEAIVALPTDLFYNYFAREVLPHVPDAWMDRTKDKIGYEIPFKRHFYVYTPPRPLEVIDAELRELSKEIVELPGGGI